MLELSYTLLLIVLLAIIIWTLNSTMKTNKVSLTKRKRLIAITLGGIFTWLIVQFFIFKTGFYSDTSLPPRLPLMMIFPLFLFTGIFLYQNRNHALLNAIPIHIPIAYQSFRAFIEVLFYFTFLKGILPIQVTFEGANYDVLLGISAIFVGYYAYYSKKASIQKLILWNVIGIGVVAFAAFTFITSFYMSSFWNNATISQEFIQFPYLLLPAFFMPSAIFMHVLSIIQLRNKLSLQNNSYTTSKIKHIPL